MNKCNAITQLISCLIVGISFPIYGEHAISYALSQNAEDTMLSCIQARYISHITSLPFLYREFNGSDVLDIKYNAASYNEKVRHYWRRFIINSSQSLTEFLRQIRVNDVSDTLYIVDYIASDISAWLYPGIKPDLLFSIPWNDTQFSPILDKVFAYSQIPDLTKKDRLNVAVWVGQLSEDGLLNNPLVNPNHAYYKNQIVRVYELSLNRPLSVCLFSCNAQAASLCKELQLQFQGCDVQIEVSDLRNPIQHFLAIQKFNVLIATQSNFSKIAFERNIFDMAIYPVHYQEKNNTYWVDYVGVVTKQSSWFPYALTAGYRDHLN